MKKVTTVESGKTYQIVPADDRSKEYLEKKYGPDLKITIEGPSREVWPNGDWFSQNGNPACILYGMRAGFSGLPLDGAYYGKIGAFGEIVHESELREIEDEALS